MSAPKVHLIDGTYELFRAWFGAPPKKSPAGREVGATRALLSTLFYLLREEKATHVGCATDHVIRSFRNDLWPTYKTDDGIAPELYGQFQLAEDAMRAAGFVVWPMVEFEADDALATAAQRYGAEAAQVVICTVDKDLAQCVEGDRVIMSDRRRKALMNEAGVRAKFGVSPKQIPDYLALVGDSADGYPGVPGFGAKTAALLLEAFGSIEAIPDDPATWPAKVRGKETLAETLRGLRDDAARMKVVATLRFDVPLTETFAELEWRGARPELRELTRELGFPELCDRVPRWL